MTTKPPTILRFYLMAILTGMAAGAGAALFNAFIALFHNLFFLGSWSFHYDWLRPTPPSFWGVGVIGVPVVGGLLVTWIIRRLAPEAQGAGVQEILRNLFLDHAALRPSLSAWRPVATSLSIGSGASVGHEGPIMQLGAVYGDLLATLARLAGWQRDTLLACGAAAGTAALFHAPWGGLVFALEILSPAGEWRRVAPVFLASFAGSWMISALGKGFPGFALAIPASGSWWAYMGLGLGCGAGAALFLAALSALGGAFRAFPDNPYWRHGVAMAILGILIYLVLVQTGQYHVEGVGFATIAEVLAGGLRHPWLLFSLFLLKLLVTALTLGSGGSGGTFSPALFLGATFGAGTAIVAQAVFPGLDLNPILGAVVGMASFSAAATGALLGSALIAAEMVGGMGVLPLLAPACILAWTVRRLVLKRSTYTLELSWQGRPLAENLYLRIRDAYLTGRQKKGHGNDG
jgi:CIC family chloride channel protein